MAPLRLFANLLTSKSFIRINYLNSPFSYVFNLSVQVQLPIRKANLKGLVISLLCLFLLPFGNIINAQSAFEDGTPPDTSKKNVKRITNLSIYYLEQLKKKNLAQAEFDAAREYLFRAEQELKAIDKSRINNAKFKLDRAFRIEEKKERDAMLNELAYSPLSYFSAEERTIQIGLFTGYAGGRFTSPSGVYADYNVTKSITGGVFLGYFMEQKQILNEFEDPKTWYGVGEKNYKFNYITTGIQGKYRFFNPVRPLFGLPVKTMHLYVAANIGVNITANPKSLQNETDIRNDPDRAGIAYGVYPGFHYQYDDYLGFDVEAGYGTMGFVRAALSWRIFMVKEKTEQPKTRNNSFIE